MILAVSLVPAACLAWIGRDVPHLGYFQDDGLYWLGAKTLAEGGEYRVLSLPGQPYQTKYPPGYPLLLSLAWKINPAFPENLRLGLLLHWLALPAYLVLVPRALRDLGFAWPARVFLAGALALSPCVLLMSTTLMADLLVSFLILASLLLAEDARKRSASWSVPAMAGLAAGAAFLTKVASLPLLVTVPLGFVLARRFRAAVVFAAFMLPAAAAWSLWVRLHLTTSSDLAVLYYTNYLGFHFANVSWHELPRMLFNNVDWLLRGVGGLIVYAPGDSAGPRFMARTLGLLAAAGAARLVRTAGLTQYHLFAAGYSLQLLLWDYAPNERFLLPLMFLLAAGFVVELAGIYRMVRSLPSNGSAVYRAAGAVLAGFVLFVLGLIAARNCQAAFYSIPDIFHRYSRLADGSRGAYEWIARNTPPDACFLANFDPTFYLHTGRRACRLTYESRMFFPGNEWAMAQATASMDQFARARNLSYILVTVLDYQPDYRVAEQVLGPNPRVKLCYSSPQVRIYALKQE